MHVLALVNQKGGCGKTTAAVNFAAALAAKGRRVLLVDLDPQAHATMALGIFSALGTAVMGSVDGSVSSDPALIIFGNEIGEALAFFCHLVDARCFDLCGPVTTKVVVALVIDENENNVGLLGSGNCIAAQQ